MRGVWLGLWSGALLMACTGQDVFACSEDADCTLAGMAGFCDAPGYCSFDDAACPSGRRFGKLAGDGLADECVSGEEAATDSIGDTTTTGTTAESVTLTSPPPSGTTTSSSSTSDDTSTTSSTTMEVVESGSSDDSGSTSSSSGSSEGSTEASTTSIDPCEAWNFEDGMIPFPVSGNVSHAVEDGELRVSWGSGETGNVSFSVAGPVDMTSGTFQVNFTAVPETTGVTVGLRLLNEGQILSLLLDGPTIYGQFYDGQDVTDLGVMPRLPGELQFRLRFENGTGVGESELATGVLRELFTWEGSFDLSAVDVQLIFQRYKPVGGPQFLAASEVQLCVTE